MPRDVTLLLLISLLFVMKYIPYQVLYHRVFLWPWAEGKWFASPFRNHQTVPCSGPSCIYRMTFPNLP